MADQWVIPDIHGCSKTLQELVETQIRPKTGDAFYFLGDYIDRGPDSKGVIDYLMTLQNNGFNAHFLKGNHEEYLLKTLAYEPAPKRFIKLGRKNRFKDAWFAHGGEICMKSFGVDNLKQIPSVYLDWINSLEYYIELAGHILVHAGLNFRIENPFDDQVDMLWTRDFEIDPEKIGYKLIVHGHVPVHIDFIKLCINKPDYHFIDLDNGVYIQDKEGFGSLTAYELNSKTLLSQTNVDFQ